MSLTASSKDPQKREYVSLGSPLEAQRVIVSPIQGGISFKNFDDTEETTTILSILPVTPNWLGRIVLAPLLSIVSCFIFALMLYWMPNLRAKFFYRRAANVHHATHLVVKGTSKEEWYNKFVEDNVEIVPIQNQQSKIQAIGKVNNTVFSTVKPLLVRSDNPIFGALILIIG